MSTSEDDHDEDAPLVAGGIEAIESQDEEEIIQKEGLLQVAEDLRQDWRLLLSLCCVGFFINCQPSEPYLSKYLTDEKNVTETQQECCVWPYDTYGSFVFLLPLGVATEIWGYRAVILFGLLCRQATRVILLYGNGLTMMATMQVTYAAATGVNTVYYAYAFIACPARIAPLAVSLINGSYHLGNVLGSLLSEWLVDIMPLRNLFYVSWGFTSIGCLLFLTVFPAPMKDFKKPESVFSMLRHEGTSAVLKELQMLYSSRPVRLWSMWWVLGYGAFNIVGNYYQNQFFDLSPDGDFGYAEAGIEASLALGAFLPAVSPRDTRQKGPLLLLVGSAVIGVALLVATKATVLYQAVLIMCLVNGVFAMHQSAAEINISHTISKSRRYAFVFTSNSFVGLGLAVVIQKTLSHLHANTDKYYYVCSAETFCVAFFTVIYATLYAKPCRNITPDNLTDNDL